MFIETRVAFERFDFYLFASFYSLTPTSDGIAFGACVCVSVWVFFSSFVFIIFEKVEQCLSDQSRNVFDSLCLSNSRKYIERKTWVYEIFNLFPVAHGPCACMCTSPHVVIFFCSPISLHSSHCCFADPRKHTHTGPQAHTSMAYLLNFRLNELPPPTLRPIHSILTMSSLPRLSHCICWLR